MKSINIFCFGFGQVAKNFIKKLIIEKYDISTNKDNKIIELLNEKKTINNKTTEENIRFIRLLI